LTGRLAPRILIPNAVIEEVRAGQHKDPPSAAALEWTAKYRVEDLAVTTSTEHWDLGLGESQVIARCISHPRWAELDDRAAVARLPRPFTLMHESRRSH